MVEYILGIGHLNKEDCKQVYTDVLNRKRELILAQATITKEIQVLNTILFQVEYRQSELKEMEGDDNDD